MVYWKCSNKKFFSNALKHLKIEKDPKEIIDIIANSEKRKITHFEASLDTTAEAATRSAANRMIFQSIHAKKNDSLRRQSSDFSFEKLYRDSMRSIERIERIERIELIELIERLEKFKSMLLFLE